MNFYLEVALNCASVFFSLVLAINVSGRKPSTTAAIDQVQNFVPSGIVGGMIYNSSITICSSPLSCLFGSLLSWFSNGLRNKQYQSKQLIDGRPCYYYW